MKVIKLFSPEQTHDPLGNERNPKWEPFVHKLVEAHPYCSACGCTHDLQGHHKVPFHVDPSRELDPANVIILCRRCHLLIGHLDDWASWNWNVDQVAAELLALVRARPYLKPAA